VIVFELYYEQKVQRSISVMLHFAFYADFKYCTNVTLPHNYTFRNIQRIRHVHFFGLSSRWAFCRVWVICGNAECGK